MGEMQKFLGLKIVRDRENGVLTINQEHYLEQVLRKYGMQECKPISTPSEPKISLKQAQNDNKFDKPYRELLGSLMYGMLGSRPDLCFSLSRLSCFQNNPTEEAWKHLKRVLRYIRGSINLKLTYKTSEYCDAVLNGYVDADWANDPIERKSVTGYVFKVFNSTVSWVSRKQPTVTLSTTEAEYVALATCACEGIWLQNLLEEMGVSIPNNAVLIHEDNQGCIFLCQNPGDFKRSKHIDVKYHFVRNKVSDGTLKIVYVPTEEQIADIFTKALCTQKFNNFRYMLGLN